MILWDWVCLCLLLATVLFAEARAIPAGSDFARTASSLPLQTNRLSFLQTNSLAPVTNFVSPEKELLRRKAFWKEMQTRIPVVESFTNWQARAMELPPDFEQLTPSPFVLEPLRGSHLSATMPSDILLKLWNRHRQEVLNVYRWWVLGNSPPAPKNVIPIVAENRTDFLKCFAQKGILRMGEDVKAEINVEMLFPTATADKFFPVMILSSGTIGMTSDSVTMPEWAQTVVARGYIVCTYNRGKGLDGQTLLEPGTGTNSVRVLAQWAKADWSELGKEAWCIQRVVDYLMTLSSVDKRRITVAGEGFYAKAAIAAAAADVRISATLAFSPGLGGFTPYRSLTETQMGAGIEGLTRMYPTWFHPRLRFFAGRETYLPFEQSDVVACIVPRALYVATLKNNPEESLWGNELGMEVLRQTCIGLGTTPLRFFLKAEEGVRFKHESLEAAFDWLEYLWGWRKNFPLQETIYPTYDQWLTWTPASAKVDPMQFVEKTYDDILTIPNGNPISTMEQWNARRSEIREQVQWGLGDTPAFMPRLPEFGPEPDSIAIQMRRVIVPSEIIKGGVILGNGVHADFYFKEKTDLGGTDGTNEVSSTKMPVVIWQPGFAVPGGYTCSELRGEAPYIELAREGFLVMVFDPIGCGTRIDEIKEFYQRFPNWSVMGKMVQDISLAVDACQRIPLADARRIYFVGYDIGAMAGLYAAALDPGIAGIVAAGGVAPLRFNEATVSTGGIAWRNLVPLLLPRLGAFLQNEKRIPYDFNELMALIAPRPQLIITFQGDSLSSYENLKRTMDSTARVYALLRAEKQFFFEARDDYNHYTPELNRQIIQFLQRLANPKPKQNPAFIGPALPTNRTMQGR